MADARRSVSFTVYSPRVTEVEAFQAAVQARVQCLNAWNTADINQILQEELQNRLVATAEQDTPSCPNAIAPVKRMWQCHREIRTLQRTPTEETVVLCAALKQEFAALQKQVRSMSKLRRQTFIDECVNKATQAARIGDVREIHVQVNRIAPKVARRQPQLRNAQGLVMTPAQETQALQEYWQGIYCSHHSRSPEPLSKYELPRELLEKALAVLPQHKALPGHYAPSLAWKLAAASISALAERTILQEKPCLERFISSTTRPLCEPFSIFIKLARTTLSVQDARFSDDIIQCEIRLEARLQHIARERNTAPMQPAPSVFHCPDCDYQAGSKAALTKHRNKVHQAALQPSHYLEWKKVDRFENGTDGLPTCRWCGKLFSSWQQLQRHIHDQVCQQKMKQVPQTTEEQDRPHTQCDMVDCAEDAPLMPPVISSTETVPIAQQHELTAEPQANDGTSSLPLPPGTPFQAPVADEDISKPQPQTLQPTVRDHQVMHTLRQATPMEALQKHTQLQAELLNHCGLCRQWTPARGGTKIHLRGSHTKEWEQAGKVAEHECLAYASHITSTAGCPFCLAPKFADKRAARAHAQNCQVLFQIVFLRILSQPIMRLTARYFISSACLKGFIAPTRLIRMAQSVEEILGPLFPALSERSARDSGSEGSNPLKRSKPDPATTAGVRGKGIGKAKSKGKGKSKGKWPQELTWDAPQEARHRPFGSATWAWKHAPGLDVEAAIYAMARLCLRQETELSELRQEKSFMLHINSGPHGILKPLIQASVKWNELRDQMKVDCSLKSELFRMTLKETAARMEKFEQTPDSIAAAEKANWVTTQPLTWLYQKWDPDAHLLVLDPSRQGIPHQEVKALLESMSEALKQDPEALKQFTPKRKLGRDHEWSLSGVHGDGGASQHPVPERQKHGREAEEVRSLTWRYGSGVLADTSHQDCVDKFFWDNSCGCALASAATLLCDLRFTGGLAAWEGRKNNNAALSLQAQVKRTNNPPTDLTWALVSAMGKKSKATWRRQGTRPGKWQRNNPVAPEEDEAANADTGAAATPGPVGLPLVVRAQPVEAAIDEEDDLASEVHEASLSSCMDQLHALPEPSLSDGASEPASSSTGAPIASQTQEQLELITSSPELIPASPSPPTPPRPRQGTRAADDAMELLPDVRVNRVGGELRRVSYPPLVEQRDGETRLAYLRRAIEESLAFKRRQESQQRDLSAGKRSQSPTAAFVLSSIFARGRAHFMCLAWCMFAVVFVLRTLQRTPTEETVVLCAALKQEFTALQKQVRSMSKLRRQTFIDECVNKATQAARIGDIREIHVQVNRIAPKVARRQPQLRNAQGLIMTPAQETQALQEYWQGIYCSQHPRPPEPLSKYELPKEMLEKALATLPQHKALPGHYAPSLAWKLAAASISALAERTILQAVAQQRITLQQRAAGAILSYKRMEDLTATRRGLTPAAAQRVAASYYRQLRTTLSVQDARFSDDIVQCEIRLEAQLQQIVRDRNTAPMHLAPSVFPCPDCDYQAGSKAALTKHRNKVHQAALQPSHYLEWKKVDRFEHGTNGLPTCRWCGKLFSSWQQLQRHIHDQVCHQTMRQVPKISEEQDGPHTQCDMEDCAEDAPLMPPAISPTETVPIAHQNELTAEPKANDDTSSLTLPPGTPFQAPVADDDISEPQPQPLQPTVRDHQVMHTLWQATPLEALKKALVLFQIVFLRVLSQPRSEGSNPLKRSKPDPATTAGVRGKGIGKAKGKDKGKSKGRWSEELTWAAIYAMAKLCLRQETELSELRQESLLLHVSAGPHGILKPLIQASVKWNELRNQMKVDYSLKSELFRVMLKETAARMEKFEQTPDSIAAAEKANWVTTQPLTWLYQK
ncbi:hypothetical protein AK812_SmicGene43899 [Symbiodinium microadriaticum]|uniref:C2H2-type domain-containing protein n=1 Tax=Symbiodinium microadriaticum TaxID=2951 RepID=A0A1Q9BZU0_SYMMI|nr:hypothetical protein AK812_SmicGene43899 [Symbiodinium microadriaticum]